MQFFLYSQQEPIRSEESKTSEIKQENIKNTLKEIISDIDQHIENEQEEEKSEVITTTSSANETSYDHITKYSNIVTSQSQAQSQMLQRVGPHEVGFSFGVSFFRFFISFCLVFFLFCRVRWCWGENYIFLNKIIEE